MKKVMTAFLAIGLFVPGIAFSQTAQQDDQNTKEQANQAAASHQMGANTQPRRTMTGTVSDMGKTLTSDNKSYVVNNPKSLKGYDDQSVSVEYIFDADNNAIHIIHVNPPQPH